MNFRRIALTLIGGMFVLGMLVVSRGSTPRKEPSAAAIDPEAAARTQRLDAERIHGGDSVDAGVAVLRLARVLQRDWRVHLPEGLALSRRALAIMEARYGPASEEVAPALENLAMWLWWSGDYAEERLLVERALDLRERADPRHEIWIAADLHLLSDCFRVQGDYGRALQLRERAGRLVDKLYGPDSAEMALHLHYLAAIEAAIGDRSAAVAHAERAVDIRERALSPTDPLLARSLNLLGSLLIDAGELGRAEALLDRARTIWEASGSPPSDTALALANLGRLYEARHEDAGAAGVFERIAAIRSAEFGADHPLVAQAFAQLGAAQRRLGNHSAARSSLRRALDIQAQRSVPSFPEWARTLRELALLDESEGRIDAAVTEALDVERITREHFLVSSVGLSEREALTQARSRVGGLDLAWGWACRRALRGARDDDAVSALLDASMRSRALVLDALAARRRILALHQDEGTGALVDALRRAQKRLTHLLIEDPTADRLAEARADADRAERELAEKSRAYREERRRDAPGLTEIRAALPRRSALVSYFAYAPGNADGAAPAGAGYAASVVTADGSPARIVPLGAAAPIDAAAHTWEELVSQDPRPTGAEAGEARYRDAARRLAAAIWDPIVPLLGSADRVFIVTDGALHRVNVSTLVAPDGTFLLEEGVSFQYLTAERDLVGVGDRAASGAGILALGDPAYGAADGSGTPRFDPLPGSRREAEQVAAQGLAREPSRVLLGDAASESEFRRAAPSFRVLHIATHAFFETAGSNAGNPLRVAGLAMAGANHGWSSDDLPDEDDGILTAEEIALLDLGGVEWAVLSACATGRGAVVPGEGVLGLRRAFQIAGAHTLIVSLWPVEDDATRDWMTLLYAARAQRATTVEAVRAASRGVLQEQRRTGRTTHPYFWGGFVSIGDWN